MPSSQRTITAFISHLLECAFDRCSGLEWRGKDGTKLKMLASESDKPDLETWLYHLLLYNFWACLNLFEPQFLYLENRNNDPCLAGLLKGLEMMLTKLLSQHLALRRISIRNTNTDNLIKGENIKLVRINKAGRTKDTIFFPL